MQAGDFAGSVKAYTEAIKRDPADPRGYNNRAAAYSKLVALPDALKDADKAIEVDPKFGLFSPVCGEPVEPLHIDCIIARSERIYPEEFSPVCYARILESDGGSSTGTSLFFTKF